jgi:uncharacterized protein YdhG (YjbR/CyaY superfamily)
MPKVTTVEGYLAAQPESVRARLIQLRAVLRKALPRAVEGISYQIPVYKVDGAMVLYFAGFKGHYSVYPVSRGVLAELGAQLEPYLHGRATLRFSLTSPVPAEIGRAHV